MGWMAGELGSYEDGFYGVFLFSGVFGRVFRFRCEFFFIGRFWGMSLGVVVCGSYF